MHVLVSGASGTVGRFVVAALLDDDHEVTVLGRSPLQGWQTGFRAHDLRDTQPCLPGADILVHCALLHEPGRFRGGEGADAKGFVAANVDGTKRLFEAAAVAGCGAVIFLSSRAVYGDARQGERLFETDTPMPDTLYGRVKLAGEAVLADLGVRGFSLRATGVYGTPPGLDDHKWRSLFARARDGDPLSSRIGTEVHGADLAGAATCLLTNRALFDPGLHIFNVSDLLLDRRDLLQMYQEISGKHVSIPERARMVPGEMDTQKLRALGWVPGGWDRLTSFLHGADL